MIRRSTSASRGRPRPCAGVSGRTVCTGSRAPAVRAGFTGSLPPCALHSGPRSESGVPTAATTARPRLSSRDVVKGRCGDVVRALSPASASARRNRRSHREPSLRRVRPRAALVARSRGVRPQPSPECARRRRIRARSHGRARPWRPRSAAAPPHRAGAWRPPRYWRCRWRRSDAPWIRAHRRR